MEKIRLSWEELKLNSDGMLPVVVQDDKDGTVLMVAYMNKEAYEQYERKMELTDQMKGLKKDIETAKTLVLTVSE